MYTFVSVLSNYSEFHAVQQSSGYWLLQGNQITQERGSVLIIRNSKKYCQIIKQYTQLKGNSNFYVFPKNITNNTVWAKNMLNMAHFEGFCVKMCWLELDSANLSQKLKKLKTPAKKPSSFLQRHKPAEMGQKTSISS